MNRLLMLLILQLGYNLSQCIFTSTVTMIQSALVLSGRRDVHSVTSSVKPVMWRDAMPHHVWHLLSDSRVFPAYYLMLIALLSLVSLCYGPQWVNANRENTAVTEVGMKVSDNTPTITVDAVYEEQWPDDIARGDMSKNKYCIIEEQPIEDG